MQVPDFTQWPEKWRWSFDCPLDFNKGKKGKKAFKYTVYLTNGEEWMSPEEVYVFVDGNDLPETMQRAHDTLLDKIALNKAVMAAARGAQKDKRAYHVCTFADGNYWHVQVDKYNEKGIMDKVVQTIHPER